MEKNAPEILSGLFIPSFGKIGPESPFFGEDYFPDGVWSPFPLRGGSPLTLRGFQM